MRAKLLPVLLLAGISVTAQAVVWLNEIHYDNTSTDVNEGFEVAGDVGSVLANFTVSGAATNSLQLGGSGRAYADFGWQAAAPQTHNAVNGGQTIAVIPEPHAAALMGIAALVAWCLRKPKI
ncbi:MAG: hypothetical protein WC708_08910 [Lentisphaeria bacterium]